MENKRYYVIVMNAEPIEADVIRKLFRHVGALAQLWHVPTAKSFLDVATVPDFKGYYAPDGTFSPAKILTRDIIVVNPSEEFENNAYTKWVLEDSKGRTKIVDGTLTCRPAALIQLCAFFGVFPNDEQRAIATFVKNQSFDVLTWLFARNALLQGKPLEDAFPIF